MRQSLLPLLACPTCGSDLELRPIPVDHEAIVEDGNLVCTHCLTAYPIVRGIPRLIPASSQQSTDGRLETASAFGFEWTHYPTTNPYTVGQYLDWIHPLTRQDFQDKIILDAGCGTGGFMEYAGVFGARLVVGLDLSDAVEVAQMHARKQENLAVVQGDILQPPFKTAFDLVYSIGVLHHLPLPRDGFLSLERLLVPGGQIFGWVYGCEGNGIVVRVVDPFRKSIANRLPYSIVKWGIAFPIAAVLFPILKLGYRRNNSAWARRIFRVYRPYFEWLGATSFGFIQGVIFDQLVAPTAYYLPHDEFAEWFCAAHLEDVKITSRNANSWRGLGRKPIFGQESAS